MGTESQLENITAIKLTSFITSVVENSSGHILFDISGFNVSLASFCSSGIVKPKFWEKLMRTFDTSARTAVTLIKTFSKVSKLSMTGHVWG